MKKKRRIEIPEPTVKRKVIKPIKKVDPLSYIIHRKIPYFPFAPITTTPKPNPYARDLLYTVAGAALFSLLVLIVCFIVKLAMACVKRKAEKIEEDIDSPYSSKKVRWGDSESVN